MKSLKIAEFGPRAWLRPKLKAPALLLMLLAGCATGSSSVVCPQEVRYTRQQQTAAAIELDRLGPDSMLGVMIADYGRLRNQVRACRG